MKNKLIKLNNILIEKKIDPKEKEKYLLIKKILNEKNAFLKMNIEYAYAILRDLGLTEKEIKLAYIELINPEN